MNPTYTSLLQSIRQIDERLSHFEREYVSRADDLPEIAGQLQQSVADIKDTLRRLQTMFEQVAHKTNQGTPSEWDLVSIVPADQGNPEQVEHTGAIPEVQALNQAFELGTDAFEKMKELLKTHSRLPREERLYWAEYIEELGKEFHRMGQLARGAHDANWYDTYY